jgi:hypothetical protein
VLHLSGGLRYLLQGTRSLRGPSSVRHACFFHWSKITKECSSFSVPSGADVPHYEMILISQLPIFACHCGSG